MGSVKHTRSVKGVQVGRVARGTRTGRTLALLAVSQPWRGGRFRYAGKATAGGANDGAQYSAAQANGKTAPCASRWVAPP
ncbi:MAG: hypothetical protein EPN57_03490 [Paraburkholderia sp.]|nr:MAG: hypothetical protein EPN57_03490 [Paraburkholderia sp.]